MGNRGKGVKGCFQISLRALRSETLDWKLGFPGHHSVGFAQIYFLFLPGASSQKYKQQESFCIFNQLYLMNMWIKVLVFNKYQLQLELIIKGFLWQSQHIFQILSEINLYICNWIKYILIFFQNYILHVGSLRGPVNVTP